MKLSGFERNDFRVRDTGEVITGYNVFVSRPISTERGRGQATERVYISDRRIEENRIKLEEMIGKEILINYNKYGKPQTIVLA